MLSRFRARFGETPEATQGENGARVKRTYALPANVHALFDSKARSCPHIRRRAMAAVSLHFTGSNTEQRADAGQV